MSLCAHGNMETIGLTSKHHICTVLSLNVMYYIYSKDLPIPAMDIVHVVHLVDINICIKQCVLALYKGLAPCLYCVPI